MLSRIALNPALAAVARICFMLAGRTTCILVFATVAEATSFTRIVDGSTDIPDGSGTFDFFAGLAFDGETVVFRGFDSSGRDGIYTGTGGELTKVADRTTPIPAGSGAFSFFSAASIDHGTVAFTGGGTSPQQRGIYTDAGGSLATVYDRNTLVPGASVNFTDFFITDFDEGSVAFRGISATTEGIYKDSAGSLALVADRSTPVPGGSHTFSGFLGPSLDNGVVAFLGDDGIYIDIGGSLEVVADTSTPIPGGSGTFSSLAFAFSPPALSEGRVAFHGLDASRRDGIYLDDGFILSLIADENTLIPGGSGTFIDLAAPLLDGGDVAFWGRGSGGQQGIYVSMGGALRKVVDVTDVLNGKRLQSLGFIPVQGGFSDGKLAFEATFMDDSEGIYVAVLPETSTVLALSACVLMLRIRRT